MDGFSLEHPAAWLAALFLALPRLTGFFLLLPFFSNQFLPPVAKFGIFVALAFPIVPFAHNSLAELSTTLAAPITAPYFAALLLKEAAVGIVAGFATALIFRVPGMIGDFIDNQRGTSIAQVFNPAQGDQSSNLGAFLGQAFLVWFLIAGGLNALLALLYESYRVLPPATWIPAFNQDTIEALVGIFIAALHLMLVLAAPAIFVMLMVDLGLGLANRFAPQLNVFFLAMPIKSVAALFALGLYFAVLLQRLYDSELAFLPLRQLITLGG